MQKEAWDTTLAVDGAPHRVSLSEDARAMLVFAPVLALVTLALTFTAHRRGRASRGVSAGPAVQRPR